MLSRTVNLIYHFLHSCFYFLIKRIISLSFFLSFFFWCWLIIFSCIYDFVMEYTTLSWHVASWHLMQILLVTVLNPLFTINTTVLHAICTPHGHALRIVMIRKHGVQAMVEFDSIETAKRVMSALNGQDIYTGCCTIKVLWRLYPLYHDVTTPSTMTSLILPWRCYPLYYNVAISTTPTMTSLPLVTTPLLWHH